MNVLEIARGLWRWTALHPAWSPAQGGPAGWAPEVGSLYHEAADAVVLIDPLAPPAGTSEAERFWQALDHDVARAHRPLAIIVGNRFHGRSADAILARYAASTTATLWAHADAAGRVACTPTHTFRAGDPLPGGLMARAVEGLEDPEVALYIPEHRALVFADAVLGAGAGQVRVAPRSWAPAGAEGEARYRALLRPSLSRLLPLGCELLLPSHGEPVLGSATAALAAALEAPAWGEP